MPLMNRESLCSLAHRKAIIPDRGDGAKGARRERPLPLRLAFWELLPRTSEAAKKYSGEPKNRPDS